MNILCVCVPSADIVSSRMPRHLQFAIRNNKELNKLFNHVVTPRAALTHSEQHLVLRFPSAMALTWHQA